MKTKKVNKIGWSNKIKTMVIVTVLMLLVTSVLVVAVRTTVLSKEEPPLVPLGAAGSIPVIHIGGGNGTMFEYHNIGDITNSGNIQGDNWSAQGVTIGTTGDNTSFTISKVRSKLYRQGILTAPNLVTVDIYDEIQPLGTILSTGNIPSGSITTDTDGAWYYIDMSSYKFSKDQEFYIVVKASVGDLSNWIRWKASPSVGGQGYAGGSYYRTSDAGSLWFGTSIDTMFEVWGYINPGVHIVGDVHWGGR